MSSYPVGLRVFLRTQNAQGDLHFVDLPSARSFHSKESPHIFVVDENTNVVSILIPDAVSFILPLVPEPSSSAKN